MRKSDPEVLENEMTFVPAWKFTATRTMRHSLIIQPGSFGDPGQPVVHQVVEMILDEQSPHVDERVIGILERLVLSHRIQLQEQALSRIASRDPCGIQEQLHSLQGTLKILSIDRAHRLRRFIRNAIKLSSVVIDPKEHSRVTSELS